MTTLRTAAQQALEALGLWATGRDMDAVALNDLIHRLEAALAEPTVPSDCADSHQPVAWMTHGNDPLPLFHKTKAGASWWGAEPLPLYTAPPQRKPLTVEELTLIELRLRIYFDNDRYDLSLHDFARAVERAHGIV